MSDFTDIAYCSKCNIRFCPDDAQTCSCPQTRECDYDYKPGKFNQANCEHYESGDCHRPDDCPIKEKELEIRERIFDKRYKLLARFGLNKYIFNRTLSGWLYWKYLSIKRHNAGGTSKAFI